MKKRVIIGAVIFSLSDAGSSLMKPEPQQIDLNDYLSSISDIQNNLVNYTCENTYE